MVYKPDPINRALTKAVMKGRIPPADRLQILSDSYVSLKRPGTSEELHTLFLTFCKEKDDGVVLLLTKLLTDLHNK